VTASVAFRQACLVPLIPEFIKLYPDIHLELLLTDANMDMISERIDLALCVSSRVEGIFLSSTAVQQCLA
jgi:DNA-binding transcriptional LysR family regulator